MRLFIAEKPSLGRAIAGGLGITGKKDGYLECGKDIVTWCFGHILEQFSPEDYDAKYKKWVMQDLPIVPDKWRLKVSKSAEKQFKIIKGLVAKADILVNAGDPDREGQLLVDEVLGYLGVLNKKPTQRILLNALDDKSVKTALSDLRDNKEFVGLRNSALARSRADWLIGMNLSRMYTLRARDAGYQGVISVGRVQTPTVALVVRRELAIKGFKPKDYYVLQVKWNHANGELPTTWHPSEDVDGLDEENRLLKKEVADSIAQKVAGRAGTVESVEQKKGQSQPRLPYSLSALQIDAGKIYGFSPQKVLDTQQSLYEKKLTTYPRSDCDYLPTNQLADVPKILSNLQSLPNMESLTKNADPKLKSRAWNDKKISAHHAIIPTTVKPDFDELSDAEQKMYLLVAKAYLAQFYPSQTFLSTKIVVACENEKFHASGKVILDDGWKKIYQGSRAEEKKDDEEEANLPSVQKGDSVAFGSSNVLTRTTKPPTRFNPSTLLKAMKEIGKYVKDESLKPVLKDCSGIGTEATRAGIIEGIQKHGFVEVSGKNLVPAEKGYLLVKVLSDKITYPDITARWEKSLDAISRKEMSIKDFFAEQNQFIDELLQDARTCKIPEAKNIVKCPKCGSPMVRRAYKKDGKTKYFWGCSKYPNCDGTMQDDKGKPVAYAPKSKGFAGKKGFGYKKGGKKS